MFAGAFQMRIPKIVPSRPAGPNPKNLRNYHQHARIQVARPVSNTLLANDALKPRTPMRGASMVSCGRSSTHWQLGGGGR
eukprot:1196595-Alexandrium_andersonii.AAC.1